MKVPAPLAKVLSIIPYIYLGFAVLLAFTNSGFIICRYDPFINLFRLSAGLQQVIYTVAFLVVSALIARPYCRFFMSLWRAVGLDELAFTTQSHDHTRRMCAM